MRNYIVHGRVQGVGFRYFTRKKALALGINGWVRNKPNGDVEILAEASPALLDKFEPYLKAGPWGSRVESVDVKKIPNCYHIKGFNITY